MSNVRTTVTLDPDTEQLLHDLMQREGITFKEAVNRAIRLGLSPRRRERFRQRTYAMGFDPSVDYDHALRVAERLEDEELTRKLALGK
jgi:hypothetical protein